MRLTPLLLLSIGIAAHSRVVVEGHRLRKLAFFPRPTTGSTCKGILSVSGGGQAQPQPRPSSLSSPPLSAAAADPATTVTDNTNETSSTTGSTAGIVESYVTAVDRRDELRRAEALYDRACHSDDGDGESVVKDTDAAADDASTKPVQDDQAHTGDDGNDDDNEHGTATAVVVQEKKKSRRGS